MNADETLSYLPDNCGACPCGRPAVKTDSLCQPVCAKCASYLGAPIVGGQPVGRNHPCTCGSGKKYKKCCGRSAECVQRETGAAVRGRKSCK